MAEEEKKPWWMCNLEEFFWRVLKWELVHDGKNNPAGQFKFEPKDIRRFTRTYRKGDFGIKFLYDLRLGYADCQFKFYEEKEGKKKPKELEVFELAQGKGG